MPLSRTRLFLEDRELGRTPVAPVIHGATGEAAGTGAQAPCCAPAMPISTFCPQDPLPAADPKRSKGPQLHHAPATHTQKLRGARGAAHPTPAHGPTGVVVLWAALSAPSPQAAVGGETTLSMGPLRAPGLPGASCGYVSAANIRFCRAMHCGIAGLAVGRQQRLGAGKSPFAGRQCACGGGRFGTVGSLRPERVEQEACLIVPLSSGGHAGCPARSWEVGTASTSLPVEGSLAQAWLLFSGVHCS